MKTKLKNLTHKCNRCNRSNFELVDMARGPLDGCSSISGWFYSCLDGVVETSLCKGTVMRFDLPDFEDRSTHCCKKCFEEHLTELMRQDLEQLDTVNELKETRR